MSSLFFVIAYSMEEQRLSPEDIDARVKQIVVNAVGEYNVAHKKYRKRIDGWVIALGVATNFIIVFSMRYNTTDLIENLVTSAGIAVALITAFGILGSRSDYVSVPVTRGSILQDAQRAGAWDAAHGYKPMRLDPLLEDQFIRSIHTRVLCSQQFENDTQLIEAVSQATVNGLWTENILHNTKVDSRQKQQ